jgi:hypothetical protein
LEAALFFVPICLLVATGLRYGLALLFPRAVLASMLLAHLVSMFLVAILFFLSAWWALSVIFTGAHFPPMQDLSMRPLLFFGTCQTAALALDVAWQRLRRKPAPQRVDRI